MASRLVHAGLLLAALVLVLPLATGATGGHGKSNNSPATGDLYTLGSDKVVYRVNPSTAIAVAEGPAFESTATALTGDRIGFDSGDGDPRPTRAEVLRTGR